MSTQPTVSTAPTRRISLAWRGATGNTVFSLLSGAAGFAVMVLLGAIIVQLIVESALSIRTFGISFLGSEQWDPVAERFGALPFIYGTLVSSLLAMVMAVPLSVGAAVFLVEVARGWVREVLSFFVEALAAVPSVVYGVWGIFVLVPWLHEHVALPLAEGWGEVLPIFAPPAVGPSMLSAAVILAIMTIPIITSVTRDVLRTVPRAQREAAFALGSTKWEAIRTVLNTARWGIFGAIVLGLGRALGETMAVTMVIGNDPTIHTSILQPAYTLASVIANEFTEATSPLYVSALVQLGLVLLLVTLVVNIVARLLVWSLARRYQRF
ncbi:MAG: phosphate ABC transporter permease subunit PstC [Candidatus Kapabacteria bacterium]|nr:phosphate ABC transporter permease subunit PstC [Candidatus Kapabacteria bacterium]